MGIFRLFLIFLDKSSRDKYLENYIGSDYKKNLDILGLNVFLLLFTCFCFIALYFISASKPPTIFNTWDGKQSHVLNTINEPILSSDKVQNWANDALKNIFSFNFYNMDRKMAQNEVYFTPEGWSAFQNALQSSQVLKNVREKSLEVWLTPLGSAKMVNRYVSGDYIIWSVEMPAIITYRGAAPVQSSRVLISTTIIRVPTTQNPNGIEISQIMVHQNT